MPGYPMHHGTQWVPTQYVMQAAAPMPQVDDSYNLAASHMAGTYKSDGQPQRGISVMLPSPETTVQYNTMIPQVSPIIFPSF